MASIDSYIERRKKQHQQDLKKQQSQYDAYRQLGLDSVIGSPEQANRQQWLDEQENKRQMAALEQSVLTQTGGVVPNLTGGIGGMNAPLVMSKGPKQTVSTPLDTYRRELDSIGSGLTSMTMTKPSTALAYTPVTSAESNRALQVFQPIDEFYRNYMGRNIVGDGDKQLQSVLDQLKLLSQTGSTAERELARDYEALFQVGRNKNAGDKIAGTVATFTSGIGAGLATYMPELTGGLSAAIGDAATRGGYSSGFKALDQYFALHPDTLSSVQSGKPVWTESIKAETGVSDQVLRSYLQSTSAEATQRDQLASMQGTYGLSDKWAEGVYSQGFQLGRQIPGLAMSTGGAGGGDGGLLGTIMSGGTLGTAAKTALQGNLATYLIGTISAAGSYAKNIREHDYSVANYANALAQGFIEYFTEGLFGFSDMPSFERALTNPVGGTASRIFKALIAYLESGAEEGLEEVVNVPLSAIVDRLTGYSSGNIDRWLADPRVYTEDVTGANALFDEGGIFDINEMWKSGVSGAIGGLLMGSAATVVAAAQSVAEGADIREAVQAINRVAYKALPEQYRPQPLMPNTVRFEDIFPYRNQVLDAIRRYRDNVVILQRNGQNIDVTGIDITPVQGTSQGNTEAAKPMPVLNLVPTESGASVESVTRNTIEDAMFKYGDQLSKDAKLIAAEAWKNYQSLHPDSRVTAQQFVNEFSQAYTYGRGGATLETAKAGYTGELLTDATLEAAYKAGVEASQQTEELETPAEAGEVNTDIQSVLADEEYKSLPEAVRKSIVSAYEGLQDLDASEYAADAVRAYETGRAGLKLSDMIGNTQSGVQAKELQSYYDAGVTAGKESQAKGAATRAELRRRQIAGGNVGHVVSISEDEARHYGVKTVSTGNMSAKQKASIAAIRRLAKMFNFNVVLYESPTDASGKHIGDNGFYVNNTATVYVDVESGDTGEQAILRTMAHELTHHLELSAPSQYNELRDFLLDFYRSNGTLEELISREHQLARQNGRNISEAEAVHEVVANGCEMMLSDTEAIQRIANEHRNLAQRIFARIREYLRAIRDAIKNMNPSSQAAIELRSAEGVFQKASKLWHDALAASAEAEAQTVKEEQEVFKAVDNTQHSVRSTFSAAGFRTDNKSGIVEVYDSNGKRIYNVTPDMVKRSVLGQMVNYAANVTGTISEEDMNKQIEGLSDLLNLMINTQDGDLVWRYSGSTMFSAIKSNSDGQYNMTVDFSTVCRKTQEMITAMSAAMKDLHRGLTRDEVIALQNKIINTEFNGKKGTVPCPVCYVFSRWAGIGGILGNMKNWQEKYGREYDENPVTLEDGTVVGKKLADRIAELTTATKKKANLRAMLMDVERGDIEYQEYKAEQEELRAERTNRNKTQKQLVKMNADEAVIKENSDRLVYINARLNYLDKEIKRIEGEGAPELAWLKKVRAKPDYWEKGNVPEDILFELNDGQSIETFAKQYPLAWAYRTGRGPSAGKAISPYAEMIIGDFTLGASKNSSTGKATFASLKNDGTFTSDQLSALRKAVERTRAQNLIGGNRYQSTSDFRYDYGLDYLLTFFELQALGGKIQTYTKIVEFAELIAAIGGDVNMSVMPLNSGLDENGHLLFSSVTGMDIEAASKANAMYHNAQLILVGINDDHIRAAMADDPRTGGDIIGFIIPYHASGASINEFIRGLVSNLGEDFNVKNYKDYAELQNDIEMVDRTNEQIRRATLRKALLTRNMSMTVRDENGNIVYNDNGSEKKSTQAWTPTEDDINFIRGRNKDISKYSFGDLLAIEEKALAGDPKSIQEYKSWSAGVLWDIYQKMWVNSGAKDTYQVKLSSTQAEHIMPHEYWNTKVNRDHAYVNGFIFRSFCYSLGLEPRFTGMSAKRGRIGDYHRVNEEGYEGYGDFRDQTGYWKTLIDRPMYNNDGTPRAQQKINVTNLSHEMLTPDYGKRNWNGYMVAEPSEDLAKAAAAAFVEDVRNGNVQRSSRATDTEYLRLAEDPEANREQLQAMVDQAANKAGYRVHAYHGTSRADRVGYVFLPERATSGPMAFFTDSERIAGEYAKGKNDTSIAYDDEYKDYHTQFRTNRNGKSIAVGDLWRTLPISKRQEIINAGKHIVMDDDGNPVFDSSEKRGLGNFDEYLLRENKGNAIEALISSWLDDGNLYGDESKFIDVLKLAGIDNVEYRDPLARVEKVYNAYLSINNPFDTASVNKQFTDALDAWYETQDTEKYEREGNAADMWDKNELTYDDWADRVDRDIENGTTHAWTSIPDFVTDYLRSQGFDGIKDTGGKNGGTEHTVWIPFDSNQVKSADPVTYDDDGNVIPLSERFNTAEPDIRYSARPKLGDLDEKQQKNYTFNQRQTETGSALKTLAGTTIRRYQDTVGKNLGTATNPQVYFNRQYGDDIVPKDVTRQAEKALREAGYDPQDFKCAMWDKAKNIYRFDEAPDFDTAREPIPGKQVTVNLNDNSVKQGYSSLIWHHKWLWVENDYDGFDVRESWERSKLYLSTIRPVPPSVYNFRNNKSTDADYLTKGSFSQRGIADANNWDEQLKFFELPTHDNIQHSLRVVEPIESTSDKWARGHSEAWFRQNGYPVREDVSEEWLKARMGKGWYEGRKPLSEKHFDKVQEGTQIPGTLATYKNIYNHLEKWLADNGISKENFRILDASSGMGLGTEEGLKRGFNVTDIEPYVSPDSTYMPDYMDYTSLQSQVENGDVEPFDFVISNAVLNVIPQDTRDNMVKWFDSVLKPGGWLYVNTLSASYDAIKNAKPEITYDKNGEPTGSVLTQRGENGAGNEVFVWGSSSVQKGFTPAELKAYLSDGLLGYYVDTPVDNPKSKKDPMLKYKVASGSVMAQKPEADVQSSSRTTLPESGKTVNQLNRRIESLEHQLEQAKHRLTWVKSDAYLAGAIEQGKAMAKEIRAAKAAGEKAVAKATAAGERTVASRDREIASLNERIDRLNDVLRETRERRDEQLQELRAHYTEKMVDYKESQARQHYRDRVFKRANELLDWVTRPTKDHYVPEILKQPVVELLGVIDMSSKRFLNGGEDTKADLRLAQKLQALNTVAQQMAKNSVSEDGAYDVAPEFQEQLNELVESATLANAEGNFYTVNTMSSEDLRKLNRILQNLKHTIINANKVYANNRFANANALSSAGIEYLQSLNEAKQPGAFGSWLNKFLNFDNVIPVDFFDRLGPAGQAIFEGLKNGQAKLAQNLNDVIEFSKNTFDKKDVKQWINEKHTIQRNGKDVDLDAWQLIELYAIYNRTMDQLRMNGLEKSHLFGGGVVFTDNKWMSNDVGARISQEEILSAIGQLSEKQLKVAKALQEYITKTGGAWGNQISMARWGYRANNEEHYWPYRSNANKLKTDIDEMSGHSINRLLNPSFAKPLNFKATNQIVIGNALDTFSAHMADMAQYNAFALPILDLVRFLNFEQRTNYDDGSFDSITMRDALKTAFGSRVQKEKGTKKRVNVPLAEEYIRGLLDDINGQQKSGRSTGFGEKSHSNMKRAAVAANLRVAILQPTAIMRANLLLNPANITQALLKPQNTKADVQEMRKYSGIARWKDLGFFEVNASRSMEHMIAQDDTWLDSAIEKSMAAAELMDSVTWSVIWRACKIEVSKTGQYEAGSQEFFDAVTAKFEDVIYRTQVVDSVLTKSTLMRNKDALDRIASQFMSEPTATYNMITSVMRKISDESRQYGRKEAWRNNKNAVLRTALTWVFTAALTSLAEALADSWRDDDEFQNFREKLRKNYPQAIIDNLSPFGLLPYASQVEDLVKRGIHLFNPDVYGFQPYMGTFDWAEDILGLLKIVSEKMETGKTNYTLYGMIYKGLSGLSAMSGIPAAAATRELIALWNNTIGKAYPEMVKRTYDPGIEKRIKYAYQDGNISKEEAVELLTSRAGITEEEADKEVNKWVRAEIKDEFDPGEEEETVQALVSEAGMSEEDAYWDVQEWSYKESTGEDYSKYDDFYTAVSTGKDLRAVIKRYTDNGVSTQTLASQITKLFKEQYRELYKQGKASSLLGYLLNAYELLGYDREKKLKDIGKWVSDLRTEDVTQSKLDRILGRGA